MFKVGLALLKYCHDDLVKLPFEELMHALRNFPEDAMDPDTLLPLAYSIKVLPLFLTQKTKKSYLSVRHLKLNLRVICLFLL